MQLVTWNIQWGLGLDGRVDLGRIAREIRRLADPDVICLQEVTDGFDDLAGNDGANQFAMLSALFPDYAAAVFAAVDIAGPNGRRRFGNMLLTRLPMAQVLRHTLPWDTAGVECMPRGCIEVVVEAAWGPVRVMTTHLEWSSSTLRGAQIEALRTAHRFSARRAVLPPLSGQGPYMAGANAAEAVLCGDFNMKPDHPSVTRLQEPFEENAEQPAVPAFNDVWPALEGEAPHPPSMCLLDQTYGDARCLDYVFVTQGLAGKLRRIVYDQTSDASDHQAVIVDLA